MNVSISQTVRTPRARGGTRSFSSPFFPFPSAAQWDLGPTKTSYNVTNAARRMKLGIEERATRGYCACKPVSQVIMLALENLTIAGPMIGATLHW